MLFGSPVCRPLVLGSEMAAPMLWAPVDVLALSAGKPPRPENSHFWWGCFWSFFGGGGKCQLIFVDALPGTFPDLSLPPPCRPSSLGLSPDLEVTEQKQLLMYTFSLGKQGKTVETVGAP